MYEYFEFINFFLNLELILVFFLEKVDYADKKNDSRKYKFEYCKS